MRSAISWALLRRPTRYRPAWLRPRPLSANRSASGRASGPREPRRGGEDATPAARGSASEENLPRLPPPPVSQPGPGGRPRLGGRNLRPSLDSSRWEAPLPGFGGCLIAAWPWAKFPTLRRAPHFPFSSLGGDCAACSSRGLRGAGARAKRLQPGRTALQPERVLPLPSLPRPLNQPQNLRFAEEPRVQGGKGSRAQLGSAAHQGCNCRAAGLALPAAPQLLTSACISPLGERLVPSRVVLLPPSISSSSTA